MAKWLPMLRITQLLQIVTSIFQFTFTIRLKMKIVMTCLLIIGFVVFLLLRYKVWNRYSRLADDEPAIKPELRIPASNNDASTQDSLGSFLDEFLSAIKIFGYIDRPVFHELTQHMQTRTLLQGESIIMDNETSYCLILSGSVQVFVRCRDSCYKSSAQETDPDYEKTGNDDQNIEQFRLISELGKGASVSSLFTILNILSENICLDSDEAKFFNSKRESNFNEIPLQTSFDNESEFENLKAKINSMESTELCNKEEPEGIESSKFACTTPKQNELKNSDKQKISYEVLARASKNTTIAAIPADSFRMLKRLHKNSSVNLVHVILSRLARVTFDTGHRYLGLTKEVMRTENLFNKVVINHLTDLVRPGTIEYFLEHAQKLCKQLSEKDMQSKKKTRHVVVSYERASRKNDIYSLINKMDRIRSKNQPGDILSNADPSLINRTESLKSSSAYQGNHTTFAKEYGEYDREVSFRECIFECLMKTLLASSRYEDQQLLEKGTNVSFRFPKLVKYVSAQQKAYFTSEPSITKDQADCEEETYNEADPSVFFTKFSDYLEILYYENESVIIEHDESNTGIYYVISGTLQAIAPAPVYSKDSEETLLYTIKPGGIAGYLSAITNYKSFVQIKAISEILVARISNSALERIIQRNPNILFTLAKRLGSTLSRIILQLDFALEWQHLNPGQFLYKSGDISDAIYLISSGRVRAINHILQEKPQTIAEFGRGESIGEFEVLTDSARLSTICAIRNTEIVKFPFTLLKALSIEHPELSLSISRVVANRLGNLLHAQATENTSRFFFPDYACKDRVNRSNVRTVAIIPVSDDVNTLEFSNRFLVALKKNGSKCKMLGYENVLQHLGRHAFSLMGQLKLQEYFAALEENYENVIYSADGTSNIAWTKTCIHEADFIFVIANAEMPTQIHENEQFLIDMKSFARKELVLLHKDKYIPQGLTCNWLKLRPWITGHHHVEISKLTMDLGRKNNSSLLIWALPALGSLKSSVKIFQSEFHKYGKPWKNSMFHQSNIRTVSDDYGRLARRVLNKSIGLVLGGGGARGISQVGVITALEEAGISIDIIGGTSIGSFNGALYAKLGAVLPVYGLAKKFSGRMGSIWRFLLDATYPTIAYTTGHEFNRGLWKTFGDSRIEDFWLPFYTNTTNITKAKMDIHTTGYAWRYVRASMSLAGLVPPICDEGCMLVDGGYMDNLTVSHMRTLGVETIFAVDVGNVDDDTPMTYGDSLSGMWAILDRWNPFSKSPKVPTMAEIQSRLTYLSSVSSLIKAKSIPGCIYLRPPISKYGTLEFNKYEEIYKVGYEYGKAEIEQLKAGGKLDQFLPLKSGSVVRDRVNLARRASM